MYSYVALCVVEGGLFGESSGGRQLDNPVVGVAQTTMKHQTPADSEK